MIVLSRSLIIPVCLLNSETCQATLANLGPSCYSIAPPRKQSATLKAVFESHLTLPTTALPVSQMVHEAACCRRCASEHLSAVQYVAHIGLAARAAAKPDKPFRLGSIEFLAQGRALAVVQT